MYSGSSFSQSHQHFLNKSTQFFSLKIYLFIAALAFIAACGLSPVAEGGGSSVVARHGL